MKHSGAILGLAICLAAALPVGAQFYGGNTFSQKIDATITSGEEFVGQFLPSRGAWRISAVVRCDVRASAYLDVSTDVLDERTAVLGVSTVELQPKQAQILVLPAGLLDIQGVRLRVVNRDKTFGTVNATISVSR